MYQELGRLGDPGAALNELVDFEAFREILEDYGRPTETEPRKGRRLPYDAVLMFKLLLVGLKCRLADEKLEVPAHDLRLIIRFLGVAIDDRLPERATIACYRAQLELYTMHELLDTFNPQLAAKRYPTRDSRWWIRPSL